jgi:hypothetical protein
MDHPETPRHLIVFLQQVADTGLLMALQTMVVLVALAAVAVRTIIPRLVRVVRVLQVKVLLVALEILRVAVQMITLAVAVAAHRLLVEQVQEAREMAQVVTGALARHPLLLGRL